MRKIICIACLMLFTILAGCRVDGVWLLESEETLTVHIHEQHGKTIKKKEIIKGDETYTRLQRWIEKNEKGWEPSLATYVPAVEVRGKKFVINFYSTSAVINFQGRDGKWRQYVKEFPLSDSEYLHLK